ncbi:MAG TPA: M28 family peptidase [Pyrinomonadaceae bacterium]|mgnify:CR=1 FL=1|nr:M28 family peptidase [Pyrinomonadaceae bacterium]
MRSSSSRGQFSAFFSIAVLLLASFLPVAAQTAAPARSTADLIREALTVQSIKDSTVALTTPEMEGRGTGQPGGEKAANWIAEKFKALGLKPLGDKGSYLQKVGFTETTVDPATSLTAGDTNLTYGTDFAFSPAVGNRTASGSIVFVGYAIQGKAAGIDQLGDVDLSGKFVVMIEGPPPGFPKDTWEKQKLQRAIMRNIFSKRPAAIISFSRGDEERTEDQAVDYYSRRQLNLGGEKEYYPEGAPVFISATAKGIEKLLATGGMTRDQAIELAGNTKFRGKDLKVKAKAVSKIHTNKVTAYNVAGVLEGSDPKLSSEAVLFSAHYDAFGKMNDKIYYGAADNALGTAEMLAVAEAYSKLPQKPKRSMIFLAVTGEEYGLFGSKAWAKDPTWDIKKVAADLNLDGIGSEVYGPVKTMVGYGAEHSTLGALLDSVAKSMEINVIPDPMPDEKVFYRSDHYSFVERGVPSLMLLGAPAGDKEVWIKKIKDWEKGDYHQPGDTVKDSWAWEGAETVAEVMAIMGWQISEDAQMPSWLNTSRFSKYDRGNSKPIPEDESEDK